MYDALEWEGKSELCGAGSLATVPSTPEQTKNLDFKAKNAVFRAKFMS